MSARPAWGQGLSTLDRRGGVLDAWFPRLGLGPSGAADPLPVPPDDPLRGTRSEPVALEIDLDAAPEGALDAYLRLHLLSARCCLPRSINLDGIFAALPNVAWTDLGPCAREDLDQLRLGARLAGRSLVVLGMDRFPRMVDYVVPAGVRIADGDRVRLGAHLAEGTVVMHEGFVNFNAGTLGASMVEGRISQGVVVGDGSDVGGGASIMGTLSGGGTEVVSIGRNCLIGANAGVGISLGDDSVVEAGCYVTAGARVTLPDGSVRKAAELSGRPGLQWWRHSVTGALEVRPRGGAWGTLNADLHTG